MHGLRRALALAQPFVMALAFGLLAWLLHSQWTALQAREWHVRPTWTVVSGACVVAGWLLEIRMWQQLLGRLHQTLGYRSAVGIWFASAVVRYLPGNVWQPLSLVARCRTRGIRPEATLASLSLFHVIHLLTVGPILVVYLTMWGTTSAIAAWTGAFTPWWILPVACAVLYLVLRPSSLLSMANVMLRRLGRSPLPLSLSTRDVVAVAGTSLCAWTLFAGGFTALAIALLPWGVVRGPAFPHIVAAYPLAFAVGFLSLITPSGFGVREGMLFALLSPLIGAADALLMAVAMRAWEILLDGAAASIALARFGLIRATP